MVWDFNLTKHGQYYKINVYIHKEYLNLNEVLFFIYLFFFFLHDQLVKGNWNSV